MNVPKSCTKADGRIPSPGTVAWSLQWLYTSWHVRDDASLLTSKKSPISSQVMGYGIRRSYFQTVFWVGQIFLNSSKTNHPGVCLLFPKAVLSLLNTINLGAIVDWIISPKMICYSHNFKYLWTWPYLVIGIFQMHLTKNKIILD